MFKPVDSKVSFPELEQRILRFVTICHPERSEASVLDRHTPTCSVSGLRSPAFVRSPQRDACFGTSSRDRFFVRPRRTQNDKMRETSHVQTRR